MLGPEQYGHVCLWMSAYPTSLGRWETGSCYPSLTLQEEHWHKWPEKKSIAVHNLNSVQSCFLSSYWLPSSLLENEAHCPTYLIPGQSSPFPLSQICEYGKLVPRDKLLWQTPWSKTCMALRSSCHLSLFIQLISTYQLPCGCQGEKKDCLRGI